MLQVKDQERLTQIVPHVIERLQQLREKRITLTNRSVDLLALDDLELQARTTFQTWLMLHVFEIY